jgi:hypothetical protein
MNSRINRINRINNLDINMGLHEHYESEIDSDYPALCPNCMGIEYECSCDEIMQRVKIISEDIEAAYFGHADMTTIPEGVYTRPVDLWRWRKPMQVTVPAGIPGGQIWKIVWRPEVTSSADAITPEQAETRQDTHRIHYGENDQCTCMICTRFTIVALTKRMQVRQRSLPMPDVCGMCGEKSCNWAEHMRYGDEYLNEYIRTGVHTTYWNKIRKMPTGPIEEAELAADGNYVWEQLAQITVNDGYCFEVDYDMGAGIVRFGIVSENGPRTFRYHVDWETIGKSMQTLVKEYCDSRVTKQQYLRITDVHHSDGDWEKTMGLDWTWEKLVEEVKPGAVQFNVKANVPAHETQSDKICGCSFYDAACNHDNEERDATWNKEQDATCEGCGAEICMGERRCIVGECPVVLAKWQEEVRLGYHDSPAYDSPCMCEMCLIMKSKEAADVVEAVPHLAGCDCSGCVWSGACGCGCGGITALHVEWETEREAQRQNVVHETVRPETPPSTPRPTIKLMEDGPPLPPPRKVVERTILEDFQYGVSIAIVALMIGAYMCSVVCF